MGSSGAGKISDYPGSSGKSGSASSGGAADTLEDRCGRAFSLRLEDAEQSDYYVNLAGFPRVGETLHVRQRKRLVAETSAGQAVGNLPTSLNYLAACMKEGWSYTGTVTAVSTAATGTSISADFAAVPPA